MAKNSVLTATTEVVAALDKLDSDERMRAVQAALSILGETKVPVVAGDDVGSENGDGSGNGGGKITAKKYFDHKDPKSKVEHLAVADRYREEHGGAEDSTKEQLKNVFSAARRNFDSGNYSVDLGNAKRRVIFNKGTGKKAVLSHRGQNFVDELPDKAAAEKVLGKLRKKKKVSKKKAKKKAKKKTS